MFYIQTVTKKSKLGNTNQVTDFLEHNYMFDQPVSVSR